MFLEFLSLVVCPGYYNIQDKRHLKFLTVHAIIDYLLADKAQVFRKTMTALLAKRVLHEYTFDFVWNKRVGFRTVKETHIDFLSFDFFVLETFSKRFRNDNATFRCFCNQSSVQKHAWRIRWSNVFFWPEKLKNTTYHLLIVWSESAFLNSNHTFEICVHFLIVFEDIF